MNSSVSFPLAPLSPALKIITGLLCALPLLFIILAITLQLPVFWLTAAGLGILYALVWQWCRPTAFVITPEHLSITFPRWQRRIPLSTIVDVRRVDMATFAQEYGFALRVGVGGLWGGFGWLWTTRKGWVEFYISRQDRFTLVLRNTGLPLLISPEPGAEFVETLQQYLGGSSTPDRSI
jgi:hypothetical protein